MTEEIKLIFDRIRVSLRADVGADFKAAWIHAEIEEGVSATGVFYQSIDDEYVFVYRSRGLDDLIYSLWEKYINRGEGWYEMTYRLSREGEESISFQASVLDNGTLESGGREAEWIRENLGNVVIRYPEGKLRRL